MAALKSYMRENFTEHFQEKAKRTQKENKIQDMDKEDRGSDNTEDTQDHDENETER